MGIQPQTRSATYNAVEPKRVKAIEFDLTIKNETFSDVPEYDFDDIGRLKEYRDGEVTITYTYEYDNSDIRNAFENPDFCEVNVMAEIKIGDHIIRVFGTDEIDIEKLKEIAASLSLYNEEILDYFDKYFTGIIIGDPTKCTKMQYQTNRDRSYEAESVRIPNQFHVYTSGGNFGQDIQLHELGHFVMSALYMEGKWDDKAVYDYYNKYKEWLMNNESSSYKQGAISYTEFFADASANYFLEPLKMKQEAPDLYSFLDGIYGGKNNENK